MAPLERGRTAPVIVSCDGGGLGAGWWVVLSWLPTRSGYELKLESDSPVVEPGWEGKRSRKALTLRAIVEDCRRYPEARVYGDFYDSVSVTRLSASESDVLRLAFVEDEDQPVPAGLIDYLLEPSANILEGIRRSFGPLWRSRACDAVSGIASCQRQLGLPLDLRLAGAQIGWKPSQGLPILFRRLRQQCRVYRGAGSGVEG